MKARPRGLPGYAIVIDLDAPGRCVEPEIFGDARAARSGRCSPQACGQAVRAHWRAPFQISCFSPAAACDLHGGLRATKAPRRGAQNREFRRNQNECRRGSFVIELADEGVSTSPCESSRSWREVGSIAQFCRRGKEHLDAALAAFAVEREDVGLGKARRIDPWVDWIWLSARSRSRRRAAASKSSASDAAVISSTSVLPTRGSCRRENPRLHRRVRHRPARGRVRRTGRNNA